MFCALRSCSALCAHVLRSALMFCALRSCSALCALRSALCAHVLRSAFMFCVLRLKGLYRAFIFFNMARVVHTPDRLVA